MDIVEPCMSWVAIFWSHICQLFIQTRTVDLPYDIILNILSRLPAELIFQCRDLCGTLCELTSSPSFINMHLNRATSVIVTQCAFTFEVLPLQNGLYESNIPLYFIDEEAKKVREKRLQITFSPISEYNQYSLHLHLFDSCNGLLMLLNHLFLVVWNPITQQQIILDTPDSNYVCGIFFHIKTRGYRVLYVEQLEKCFRFIIMCMRTRSTRRTNSFSHPPYTRAPVILNGMLHWLVSEERYKLVCHESLKCSESILSFDMDKENMRAMARPRPSYGSKMDEIHVHLGKQNGILCLCQHGSNHTLEIWNLIDYENVVWIKSHTISLNFVCRIPPYFVGTLQVDNDELIVPWVCSLIRYNLKSNMSRNVKSKGIEDLLKCYFLVHTNSLVTFDT